MHMLGIAWGTHGEPFFLRQIIQEVLMYAFFAVGFIFSGEKMAPNYKVKTAYFLSAMICLFSLINIAVYIMDSETLSIATAANFTSLVVAILIILYKHEENRQWQG
jgi:peptidoglycan/LPS O-acetylase OafA/YrhL